MRLFRTAALLCAAVLMHGCATVKPTTVPQNFWTQTGRNISVSVQRLPQPTSNKLGAQGLLDMAINSAVASGWDAQVKSVSIKAYDKFPGELVTRLNQRGFNASAIDMKLADLPKYVAKPEQKQSKTAVLDKDLKGVAALAGADYLLLVNPLVTGTARNYYGFMPLNDPSGYFVGYATLVDVRTNEIKWWKDLMVTKIANVPWDQPPAYPNLTQAVVQAVDDSREQFMKELFANAPALPAAPAASPVATPAAAETTTASR